MYCRKCGKENPEDAVFCMKCGNKLNLTPTCRNCEKEIPEEAVFCPYCGTKQTDGVTAEAESEICSTSVQTAFKPVRTVNTVTAKKVMSYTLSGLVIFLAAVALIFVLFTGVSLSVPYGANVSEVVGNINATSDFIYYFGEAYKDVSDAISQAGVYTSDYFEVNLYLNAIFGTLIGVATVITVAVFSVIAIVKGVKGCMGKGNGDGAIFAISAFIAYVCGAVALNLICGVSIDYVYRTEAISCATHYNDATVAGIVLGSVAFAGIAGLKIACNAKGILNAKNAKNLVMSTVGIVLVAVLLGIFGNSIITLKSVDSYTSTKAGINPLVILSACSGIELSYGVTVHDTKEGLIECLNGVMVLSIVIYIILFTLLVFIVLNFLLRTNGVFKGRQDNRRLTYSILILLFSIAALVLTIILCNLFKEVLRINSGSDSADDSMKFGYATLICAVVFSVFNLVSDIVHTIICKKKPPYEQIMFSQFN